MKCSSQKQKFNQPISFPPTNNFIKLMNIQPVKQKWSLYECLATIFFERRQQQQNLMQTKTETN